MHTPSPIFKKVVKITHVHILIFKDGFIFANISRYLLFSKKLFGKKLFLDKKTPLWNNFDNSFEYNIENNRKYASFQTRRNTKKHKRHDQKKENYQLVKCWEKFDTICDTNGPIDRRKQLIARRKLKLIKTDEKKTS